MIRTAYIVYQVTDGKITPHTHPVFTGDVAYDLPNAAQSVTVDEATNCREFANISEVYQAVQDYIRSEKEPVDPGQFIVMPINSVIASVTFKSKAKTKK